MKLSQKIAYPLAAFALVAAGAVTTVAVQSHAQTTSNTTDTSSQTQSQSTQTAPDQSRAFHSANGKTEQLLTGNDADTAKAAALKAVPGGTIERVETDADGDAYEAHMLDSSGNPVTVKFDSNFNVVRTESGPSTHGGQAPQQN